MGKTKIGTRGNHLFFSAKDGRSNTTLFLVPSPHRKCQRPLSLKGCMQHYALRKLIVSNISHLL